MLMLRISHSECAGDIKYSKPILDLGENFSKSAHEKRQQQQQQQLQQHSSAVGFQHRNLALDTSRTVPVPKSNRLVRNLERVQSLIDSSRD